MSDLLDAFTKFVAWLGDESARNGYFTGFNNKGLQKYSINVGPGVSPQYINQIVQMIHLNLTTGKEIKGKFPENLKDKIDSFVKVAAAGSGDEKAELLAYMSTYNAEDDGGMRGGARTTRKNKGKKSRKGNLRVNRHKTRSLKRK